MNPDQPDATLGKSSNCCRSRISCTSSFGNYLIWEGDFFCFRSKRRFQIQVVPHQRRLPRSRQRTKYGAGALYRNVEVNLPARWLNIYQLTIQNLFFIKQERRKLPLCRPQGCSHYSYSWHPKCQEELLQNQKTKAQDR